MNAPLDPQPASVRPTRETYERLQQAYDHFNKTLFDGTLPNALITLQRRKKTFGYFAGARFAREDGRKADEIALNPASFHERSVNEILATLVHDMVHLWQHHCGTPGRGRYHNREWAAKMKAIGLQPTIDGAEGGKETGESVGHFIVPGGPFETALNRLLAKDFALVWKELPAAADDGKGEAAPAPKSGKRVRYACPQCDLKAWARHDARLVCGADMTAMTPT